MAENLNEFLKGIGLYGYRGTLIKELGIFGFL